MNLPGEIRRARRRSTTPRAARVRAWFRCGWPSSARIPARLMGLRQIGHPKEKPPLASRAPPGSANLTSPNLHPGTTGRTDRPVVAIVGGGVALERVVLVLAEYLTGGGHHLAVQTLLPVQVAQRSENAVDFYPGEPRARLHAELTLHVVRRVQHHAACRFAVPAGASGLLKIVLQRTRDVGVDDQPHVRLVYPHAEGVGRRNRA